MGCQLMLLPWDKQGHRHNGDRDARRPHVLCLICFYSFGAFMKVVLYDCSLHHFTTSQCILKCVRLKFSTTSNWLAEIWTVDFSIPGSGVTWVSGIGLFISPPTLISSPWTLNSPLTHTVYLSTFFSYSAGSNSIFAHPTWIRLQILLLKLDLCRNAKITK